MSAVFVSLEKLREILFDPPLSKAQAEEYFRGHGRQLGQPVYYKVRECEQIIDELPYQAREAHERKKGKTA